MNERTSENVLRRFLEILDQKNSWGKTELKNELLKLLVEVVGNSGRVTPR